MSAIKDIYEHLDLYGSDVLLTALKAQFSHVSMTKNAKTLAKQGSAAYSTSKIKTNQNFVIDKAIFHKSGAVTVKTKYNHFFTFINL